MRLLLTFFLLLMTKFSYSQTIGYEIRTTQTLYGSDSQLNFK
jgi:hypothetical protein